MAPAARQSRRDGAVDRSQAASSAYSGEPNVVRMPATLVRSLTSTGTPASGPASRSSLSVSASAEASSARRATTAFSSALCSSMRRSDSSTSSRGDTVAVGGRRRRVRKACGHGSSQPARLPPWSGRSSVHRAIAARTHRHRARAGPLADPPGPRRHRNGSAPGHSNDPTNVPARPRLAWRDEGVDKWMAYDRGTGELVGRGGASIAEVEGRDQLEVGWALCDRPSAVAWLRHRDRSSRAVLLLRRTSMPTSCRLHGAGESRVTGGDGPARHALRARDHPRRHADGALRGVAGASVASSG